jgi:hypothetical protein
MPKDRVYYYIIIMIKNRHITMFCVIIKHRSLTTFNKNKNTGQPVESIELDKM